MLHVPDAHTTVEPVWNTACPDWERRILAGESLVPGPPLFPEQAVAAVQVFRSLPVFDVPGRPTMGDVTGPWALDFVSSIFGAYDVDTGQRLINSFMLLVSSKNCRSTIGLGILLTALGLNRQERAEFLLLAPTSEAATDRFGQVRSMVCKDPVLSELLQVQVGTRTIVHRQTGATLKMIGPNSDLTGKTVHGIVVDGLEVFGQRTDTDDVLREAAGCVAARPDGFMVYLATQASGPPRRMFRSLLDYARLVRDGVLTDRRFLPVLYEFPAALLKAEKHQDPAHFYITNPNLGRSIDLPFLEREHAKATVLGPQDLRWFQARHLNVEHPVAGPAKRAVPQRG